MSAKPQNFHRITCSITGMLFCLWIKRPRCIYYGDKHNEIALQETHHNFTLVKNYIKKGEESKTKDVEFKVGYLVYYKTHHKKGKLDMRWWPYYVVVEKTVPVSYRIRDPFTGLVTKTHAEHLWELENSYYIEAVTENSIGCSMRIQRF